MFRRATSQLYKGAVHQNVDNGGLREFSVVFTDRSLNHMSKNFGAVMRNMNKELKHVYDASQTLCVPGTGTIGMEATARQFARGKKALIVRNGWFSYRWSQIFEQGNLTTSTTVLKARRQGDTNTSPFAPCPIDEVTSKILEEKPGIVCCPHIETSAGIVVPESYIREIGKACRQVDAIFVLDGIASGCDWVQLNEWGIDVYTTAPQKGWSSTPCSGIVMMGERGLKHLEKTQSDSFSLDLKKWKMIADKWEDGLHAYHCTMPTDGLVTFNDRIMDTKEFGYDKARAAQLELGASVRAELKNLGYKSVAAEGFGAGSVCVSYTDKDSMSTGKGFGQIGVQIAAGVPLEIDEGKEGKYQAFRIGLFGLDKLTDVSATVEDFKQVMADVQ